MPSQILHIMFGEDVITGLYNRLIKERGFRYGLVINKAMERINLEYRSAFILGCQGPDIFYHSQRRRPVAVEYGSLLHRRGCGVFTAGLLKMGLPDPPPGEDGIKSGREKGINAMGVYALGFMTHAVLDRFCHPYIVYRADRDYHSFFERIIDVLMLKELRGMDPASWDQEKILADVCENPPLGLKELIARSLASAFSEKVNKDRSLALRIDNAFTDCANFYNMTSLAKIKEAVLSAKKGEKTFTRRALFYIYPENLPSDIDFLNLSRQPWRYPYVPPLGEMPEPDNRSFLDVYQGALKAAVDALSPCIIQYLDSGLFPIAAAARSIGNSSLSIQNEHGKPCAPNLTDPLPLHEVLNQQAKLRGIEN